MIAGVYVDSVDPETRMNVGEFHLINVDEFYLINVGEFHLISH